MPGEVGNRGDELRRRAKARLEELPADREVMNPQALQSLVHELQVHQIELEMQNEELRRTQQELAASRDRYADLYDFAPVGYLTVGEQGMIQEANLTAASLLGVERDRLLREPFFRFVVAENQDTFYHHRRRILIGGERQICELRLRKGDGTVFWAQLESRRVMSGDSCSIALSDITVRKRTEESLKQVRHGLEHTVQERTVKLEQHNRDLEEKERLLTAFHQIGQAVLETLDLDEILDRLATQIIEAGLFRSLMIAQVREEERRVEVVRNYMCYKGHWGDGQGGPGRTLQPGERVVLRRSDLILVTNGKTIGATYSLDDDNITPTVARTGRMEVIEEWSERFDQHAGKPEARKGKVSYFIPVKKGERVLVVLATGSEMEDKEETLRRIEMMQPLLDQMAIALEHAHLFARVRQGQHQLRALSRRLVEVQEEERRAVARELHDEIGQELTGLKMFLEMSASAPADDLAQHLENARQTIGRLMEQVRNLSRTLRPSALDDLGLLPALQLLFRNLHDQTGLQVGFRHLGLNTRFPSDIEIGAYRIIQESLNNAVRHAGVSRVSVRVWKTDDQLGLQIEDPGCGFDLDIVQARETVGGLRGMQERASLLAGELSIESEPGTGTRITAELPLQQREPQPR